MLRKILITTISILALTTTALAASPTEVLYGAIDFLNQYADQVCPKQDIPPVCQADVLSVQTDAQQGLISIGNIGLAITTDNTALEADSRNALLKSLNDLSEGLKGLKEKYGKIK